MCGLFTQRPRVDLETLFPQLEYGMGVIVLNRIELTFWTGVDLATISLDVEGTPCLGGE